MNRPTFRASWIAAALAVAACTFPAAAQDHAGHGQGAAQPAHTDADVRFIEGMLAHHGQALEMTALVPQRASREDVRLMAERIEVSQRDEIEIMHRWLRHRGLPVPDTAMQHMHAGMHHEAMPGMLTPEEMARLADSTGPAFDRLFLESMIRHHEGALTMVAQLFATAGAGQGSDIYDIAAQVDSDQRIEIARMWQMLEASPPAPSSR